MVFDAAGPAALAVVKALVFGAVEGALLATAKKKKQQKNNNKQTEKTMRRQRNQNKTVYSSNLI